MGPDPSILLTHFKKEADLPLTQVLFEPAQSVFLTPTEKIINFGIFRENFPNSKPNQRWLTRPDPSLDQSESFYSCSNLKLLKQYK